MATAVYTHDHDVAARRVRQMRAAVTKFRDAYVAYLNCTLRDGQRSGPEFARRRKAVAEALPGADRACIFAGGQIGMQLRQGPYLSGLSNLAFIHETPFGQTGYITKTPPAWQRNLDHVDSALAALEELEGRIRARRRNPLYWANRLLRAVLGFPAYLVSLVLRVPAERVEDSVWGVPLRIAGLLLEAALVVIGGNEAGWW